MRATPRAVARSPHRRELRCPRSRGALHGALSRILPACTGGTVRRTCASPARARRRRAASQRRGQLRCCNPASPSAQLFAPLASSAAGGQRAGARGRWLRRRARHRQQRKSAAVLQAQSPTRSRAQPVRCQVARRWLLHRHRTGRCQPPWRAAAPRPHVHRGHAARLQLRSRRPSEDCRELRSHLRGGRYAGQTPFFPLGPRQARPVRLQLGRAIADATHQLRLPPGLAPSSTSA